jgi:hypothetical protein
MDLSAPQKSVGGRASKRRERDEWRSYRQEQMPHPVSKSVIPVPEKIIFAIHPLGFPPFSGVRRPFRMCGTSRGLGFRGRSCYAVVKDKRRLDHSPQQLARSRSVCLQKRTPCQHSTSWTRTAKSSHLYLPCYSVRVATLPPRLAVGRLGPPIGFEV